ncbi:Hypothetical predicted protein [Olea europaea subsp. europaea]|uniref:Transposase n=1 Tax=Olea europaea subsp. europaea TaxID=158383 RepID=A0A8S0REG0_OLEEU|nr:Hypothetical predicted protein [Olea europaea subsp. europaea]
MVIPGPKRPGKNLDVFLRPLIDELKILWDEGVYTYDIQTKQNFQLKATLMWTISDISGYSMLSGWSTHGLKSCLYCMGRTKSFRLKNGGKTSFFDCHRQFLPPDHAFRKQRDKFYKGRVEKNMAQHRLTGEELRSIVENLPHITSCKAN